MLNRKRIANLLDTFNKGTMGSLLPMANVASEVAYGAVILSFVGGAHWGFGSKGPGSAGLLAVMPGWRLAALLNILVSGATFAVSLLLFEHRFGFLLQANRSGAALAT